MHKSSPPPAVVKGLAEILERVLDKGVVIAGDIRIKLCDIELLSIQIRLLVCSVDKAREMGLTWWWQQPQSRRAAAVAPFHGGTAAGLGRRSDANPVGAPVQIRENVKRVK